MEKLEIRVETKVDADNGKLSMQDVLDKNPTTCTDIIVCIHEDMTTEHKSAVSFTAKTPEGKYVSFHITENNMDGLMAAFRGAKERFASEKAAADSITGEEENMDGMSSREILIATGVKTLAVEYPTITKENILTEFKEQFRILLDEVMKAYEVDEEFKKLYRETGGEIK